jgi:fructose-bisphosphate aldolase class I
MTALWRHGVQLEACLLKPQMVLPGAECSDKKPSADDIAKHTLSALRRYGELHIMII